MRGGTHPKGKEEVELEFPSSTSSFVYELQRTSLFFLTISLAMLLLRIFFSRSEMDESVMREDCPTSQTICAHM